MCSLAKGNVSLICLAIIGCFGLHFGEAYVVDDSRGLGPRFDGIGGLSGGGATSRLLPTYKEPQRSQILDLLFKPKFAASLHILKVEIGGDGQSTDGTESSHMHSADDENYQRGYEWWLMTEAKKRNPDIKLYGLPWAYPAWVGNGSNSPYTYPYLTASYIGKWLTGAKEHYNLTIDYVGIWNERNFDSGYIKCLQTTIAGLGLLDQVQIVAADSDFNTIANAVNTDPELAEAVSILGAHYPGTYSSDAAVQSKKPLWASEDYSTFNDDVGAGCWARILNQNYVNGRMTSTISWNLIASYYEGLPYYRDGLMTAIEPWSGHFEINGPMWISAHTTQFTKPGDYYLQIGSGAGHLDYGGSYVSFMDPNTKDITIVIETMSHNHSVCIRPPLPTYTVKSQVATFELKGTFASVFKLYRWDSQLFGDSTDPQYFVENGTVQVSDGQFTINLPIDHVVTLSTKTGQVKGLYDPPVSSSFPLPYSDNFEGYPEFSEADYFADQAGVYEIRKSSINKSNQVMMQVVPTHVISWCGDANQTITLMGNNTWKNYSATVDIVIPSHPPRAAAFLAGGIDRGGCSVPSAHGTFFWISTSGSWKITSDLAGISVVKSGSITVAAEQVHTVNLDVQGGKITATVDGKVVVSDVSVSVTSGYVGFGTSGYFAAEFDSFVLNSAQ